MTYYVYILYCSNHSYYTGYTTDIRRRYREHVNGSSKCKYTRSFSPIALAGCWIIRNDLSMTLKVEKSIKALTKAQKTKLCQKPQLLSSMLPKLNMGEVMVPNFNDVDKK